MKLIIENWKKYITEETGLEDSSSSLNIKLPKFRISEEWGTPGTDDRRLIEKFTSKIRGNTLEEKINSFLFLIFINLILTFLEKYTKKENIIS